MAFFDDMSKKLTMAGQSAVQKTKDLAEITRLNGMISEEERRLESTYSNLGKVYFSLHSEDCEDDFKAMVADVKECEIKIEQYRQMIKDIKGVRTCENCGGDVPSGAAFCSCCGTPVAKKIPEDMVQCPKCGQLVSHEAKFCTGCGISLMTTPSAEAVTAPNPAEESHASEEVAAPNQEEKSPLTCSNCNCVLSDDVTFCTQCGTKVR